MRKLTVKEMMKAVNTLESQEGLKCTLLGIGPMSKPLLRASFELAKEKDFPLMFIASRNQVEIKELGGGYVCNWDPYTFVQQINETAEETGFDGIYYVCRDHGGPWQRDNERAAKLAVSKAMDIARQSYFSDLRAGFDLLHIDPTKDPHIEGIVPMEIILNKTHELIANVERERKERGLPPIAYEVGTEETNGGLTTSGAYTEFIGNLFAMLQKDHLPLPDFIVGQTGTLTRMTENVGNFDASIASDLSKVARKFGAGLKEHNADYLSDFILHLHPLLGINAANVAPEFGVAETKAYLLIANVEADAYERKLIKEKSNFLETIRKQAVLSGRWRKWMVGGDVKLSDDEVLSDYKKAMLITEVSGHYTFELPEVIDEKEKMFSNLQSIGLQPDIITSNAIKNSIGRYVDCFNLAGLTSKIYRISNYSGRDNACVK